MSELSYVILFLNIILELGLICRLLVNSCWKRYLWLFVYLCFTLIAMDITMFAIFRLNPGFYGRFYWECESFSMGLRFVVLWDIFRQSFRRIPALFRTASTGLVALALVPLLFSLCAFLSRGYYQRFFHPYFSVERSLDLIQAVLVFGILAAARYYGVCLGRNIRGIAVGLGTYLSVSIVIFSLVDLRSALTPIMQALNPLSFLAMLAIWMCALWVYAPNPPLAANQPAVENSSIRWWEAWGNMLESIRRAIHP